MKRLLFTLLILGASTFSRSNAQTFVIDTTSILFPDSCDSNSTQNLLFNISYFGPTISNETVHIDYRVKNGKDSAIHVMTNSEFKNVVNNGDTFTIQNSIAIVDSNAFFVGEDIVVIWPTGSGGIIISGDSIIDSFHVYLTAGINRVNKSFSITLSPNPTQGLLYLNYDQTVFKLEQVRICNIFGQTVLAKSSLFNTITINSLPDGFYVLEAITTDKSLYTTPFIKTR